MTTNRGKKVSVNGLGQMGRRIAELYVNAGYEVSVWNRTRSKADALKNVKVMSTFEESVDQGDFHIICVLDNTGTHQMIESLSDKSILTGKTFFNFTTGSPKEVEELENLLNQLSGQYLNGAIQVAPDQMGLKETTILMGGRREVLKKYDAELQVLGGNVRHVGEKAATSSAMDLATLTWLYGSYIGLIYGVKLSQASGLRLSDYEEIIGDVVPGFTDFFKHQIKTISQGNFEVTQSPLEISVSATKRIADMFKELAVAQEFPDIIASILKKADGEYGGANKEVAILAKTIETKHL
jgi:3-hydroxyisobutyrate dehydrogenase-like beta-hydroxyacid dehydrogenase